MNSIDPKKPRKAINRKTLIGMIVAACLLGVVLFCGGWVSLLVMSIRQAQKERPPASPFPNSSPNFSPLPPQQPLVVSGDALFALRSSDGRALSFRTFVIRCNKPALDVVFTESKGLYVEQSDSAIALIPMDKLAGYSFDGNTAIATLMDGGRILGSPFIQSVKGETPIGEVTVDGKKIAEVKFATDRMKKFMQTEKTYPVYRPEDLKIRGVFTLNGGSTLSLTGVGLQTWENNCDHMWIPCKPYTSYAVGEKLNIKYGGFASQLEISKIEQLGVRTSGDQNPIALTIKLRDGESIEALLNKEDGSSTHADAFVGVDERGVIFIIPFKAIQSATLK